jgi:nucleoside-diphosphate-sugar epimerase
MAVNALGTWHVLLAAEAAGVTRVIHFSSASDISASACISIPRLSS